MVNKSRLMYVDDFLDLFYASSAGQDKAFVKTVEMVVENTPTVDAAVLPCKVGSEVFNIWQSFDDNGVENFEIYIGEVVSFSIQKDSIWAYCQYRNGLNLWHTVDDAFGKTVFLTREEAEAAIAKMDGGDEDENS